MQNPELLAGLERTKMRRMKRMQRRCCFVCFPKEFSTGVLIFVLLFSSFVRGYSCLNGFPRTLRFKHI